MKRSLVSIGRRRALPRNPSHTTQGTTNSVPPAVRFGSSSAARSAGGSTAVDAKEDSPVRVTQTRLHGRSHAAPAVSLPESRDATALVDGLMASTRRMMDGASEHVVAFSGGIDSSVVAALVHHSKLPGESVTAVLGVSPAVPEEQAAQAEEIAGVIGVDFRRIHTTEGTDATYIANTGEACLACKTHLYSCLESIVQHHQQQQQQQNQTDDEHDGFRIYNGTNADDLTDATRLGLIAAEEFGVRSPLESITKQDVRVAGKHLGLPNWNHAAAPCLRSRLALGVAAIPEHLKRIEAAERRVRASLGLDATSNLRVRLLSRNRAMVEVEEARLEPARAAVLGWEAYFCGDLGFSAVDVRSFRSGSVAGPGSPAEEAAPGEEEAA